MPVRERFIPGIGEQLEESIELSSSISREIREYIPQLILRLKELADGIWRESDQQDQRGGITNRIYKVKPDRGAIEALFNLANTNPESLANTLLSVARAKATTAQASYLMEQRKLCIENALTIARNRLASDRSLVDEEKVESSVSKSIVGMLAFIQQLQLDEYPLDEPTRVKFVERYKDRCLAMLAETLEGLEGAGSLEPYEPPKKKRGRPKKSNVTHAFDPLPDEEEEE